jgi:hypothetical protein
MLVIGFALTASAAPVSEVKAEDPVTVAVTCSGAGCDGKDPYASGCAATGNEVGTRNTSKGLFRLYYSGACRTNWIEIRNYAGGSSRPDGKLELTVWDVPRNKTVRYYASSTPGRHWGDMVYSPGSNCAWGFADWNGGDWDVRVPSPSC